MFNKYVWSLYRDSTSGKLAVKRAFPRFAHLARHPGSENWRDQLNAALPVMIENLALPEDPWTEGENIWLRELLSWWLRDQGDNDLEIAFLNLLEGDGLFYSWTEEAYINKRFWAAFGGEAALEEVASNIGVISTMLHREQPEKFIPYYFEGRFLLLCNICSEFGIAFPEIPGKLQKKERATFYLEINRALQDFRCTNGLSPNELNAFLYDFAPAFFKADEDEELPAPRRAWFLMAGVGTQADFDFLDQANITTESLWRGHRDAQRGDIAVLWCASPRAYLHSIWQVVEDGHDDPFSHWYSLVRVGRPVQLPHLKLKDLKENPVLKNSPMVRAHFQGCAGKYLPTNDYLALREMCMLQGSDINKLPSLESVIFPALASGRDILSEREVEEALVEPLLKRLGYEPGRDWQRQVRVRMGRGEKVFPDYVIGLTGALDQERANLVVESKFRISTAKDLRETFLQGRSYAIRLRAKVLVLAALEGIWVMSDDGEFSLSKADHWSWAQLEVEAIFQKLRAYITLKN